MKKNKLKSKCNQTFNSFAEFLKLVNRFSTPCIHDTMVKIFF